LNYSCGWRDICAENTPLPAPVQRVDGVEGLMVKKKASPSPRLVVFPFFEGQGFHRGGQDDAGVQMRERGLFSVHSLFLLDIVLRLRRVPNRRLPANNPFSSYKHVMDFQTCPAFSIFLN
jgi:hypothetical protein